MEFLKFDQDTLCNVPYPVNDIKYRLTFYKITGFRLNLNEIDYAQDGVNYGLGPIRKVVLGLPLGVILSQYFLPNHRYKCKKLSKSGALSFKVGIDDVFMPFDAKLDPDYDVVNVLIHGNDVKKKVATSNGVKIPLTSQMIRALENGETFLYKKGTSVYNLQRAEVTQYVGKNALTTDSVFSNYEKHKLSKEQINELTTTGKLTIDFRGDNIKFFLASNSQSGKQVVPMARASSINITVTPNDSLIDYARNLYPPDNPDEFDNVLGVLLAHPRAGGNNNRIGKESSDASLNTFISQMPWILSRSSISPLTAPWKPFDLETLLRLYERYNQGIFYARYVSRFVNKPKHKPTFPKMPTFAKNKKLPQYEIGIFTTYEQEWQLLGYSRGALLSSISLAPREELSIEIFTFDRFKTENEKTFSTEFESNLEINSQVRTAAKIARDLTTTTDTKGDLKLGIPIPAGDFIAKADVNAGINQQVKEGIQTTIDELNDKTIKSTERLKSTTQVKIVQSSESGEEKRVIRKIQNPNVSRTLTFNYFEILENYAVTTKYTGFRLCLLVSNPDLGLINLDFVLAYEDRLSKALLSPIYQPGFDAAKILAGQRWFEEKRTQEAADLEKSENEEGQDEDPKKIDKNIIRIAKNLRVTLNEFLNINTRRLAKVLEQFVNLNPLDDDEPSDEDSKWAQDAIGMLYFWEKFKIQYPTIQKKAEGFVESILDPIDEATALATVESFVTGLDDDWVSSLKSVAADIVLGAIIASLFGPQAAIAGAILAVVADFVLEKNLGLPSLITEAKREVKIYQGVTSVGAPPLPAADTAATVPQAPAAPEVFSLNELATANADFQRLLLHIEVNKVYYINKIWAEEIPEVRMARFRLKGIDRYLDNQLLGFVGEKAAYPLRLEALPGGLTKYLRENVTETLEGIDTETDGEIDYSATVPTNGVYMEAMLGNCDALEPYMQDRRDIDLQTRKAAAIRSEAEAAQQVEEVNRLQARLAHVPPLLDSPFTIISTVPGLNDGVFDTDNQ